MYYTTAHQRRPILTVRGTQDRINGTEERCSKQCKGKTMQWLGLVSSHHNRVIPC